MIMQTILQYCLHCHHTNPADSTEKDDGAHANDDAATTIATIADDNDDGGGDNCAIKYVNYKNSDDGNHSGKPWAGRYHCERSFPQLHLQQLHHHHDDDNDDVNAKAAVVMVKVCDAMRRNGVGIKNVDTFQYI